MKLKMKRFLEILLSLTLVLGLVPGMSMTAYAVNYSEGDEASIFSISVGDTFDAGSKITRDNSAGVVQEIYVDDYFVFKYYGPGTYTVNENLTLTAVDGVKYYFDSTDTNDLTNATVTVDTANASTTIKIGDKNVGPAKYDVKYGSTPENATADFPTQAGSYYAFVTAKETADNYIGKAKSAVFTISAADTVTWTSIANNKSENGITVTTSDVTFNGNYINGYNGSMTFTSTVGKIKKIEISGNGYMDVYRASSGWNECSGSGPLVWNGTASDSVTLSARTIDISGFAQIVYTIEAKSDISDTTVTVDTNNQRVSVTRGNAFIPEDEYTVTYGADAEHATLTDFPTKAGTYVAVVTAKTDSTYYKGSVTSVEFTIPKADVLIVSLPEASAITYGQTLADSALTGGTAKSGDSEVEGIFEWKNKNIKPAVSDSEMTEYDVVFTPEDADNYAMVECKVKLTVNKAAPTITAPTAKTGLVYTSSAQKLVNTGSTNDGILYYAVTTENTAPTDDNLYSTSIPTGTNAGTYYVWYMVEGDENHEDISAECITVTISHKLTKHEAVEPTATKDGNITYWTCDCCGKFFSDEDGKTEIKEADTIISATGETPEEPTPEEPTPEEPTPKGELSKVGIYCSQDNPSVIAAFLTKKSIETDTIEYRWVACESDNPNSWFIVSDWTKDNFYLSWTPEKDGDYVIVAQARLVGNEEETMVSDSFGVNYRTVKPKIKDICQIPVEDGYLIGIESTENPNQSLTYEMLILDLSLLADGNPDCWIYGVKGQTSEGNALWTIWKPQYGYYITLFRIYDENGNQLDQTAYGFVNAY